MAVPDPDGASDAAYVPDTFLEHSYLTYIIPFATDFSPEEALRQSTGSVESAITSIEQRDQLFFDETADVYFILRAPCPDEPTFRSHLGRLSITLDAHIVNGAAADRDAPPASEIIFNGSVEDVDNAFVVVDETQEEGQRHGYAVWKLPVFLARPRMRLQLPSVVFSGVASLGQSPVAAEHVNGTRAGYMQSCTPSGMNLLESFANDPLLSGVAPRLSAQRVSKVAPLTRSKDELYRINGLQQLKLKIFPVLHTRVRFSRPNTTPPSASMTALLEVDFTPYFDCEAALDKIALSVANGTAEDLNDQVGMSLPLSCVAHDHLTFLYKLAPEQLDIVSKNLARELLITIEVLVLVRPEGEPNPCTPRLVMTWTTALDFTPPVNPGFGQLKTQAIQRSHRPSQLSISGFDSQPLVSPSVMRPDALPTLEAATVPPLQPAFPDFGVTMTFTGPSRPVLLGEEFTWTVFVVNRSRPDSLPPAASTTGQPSATPHHPPTAAATARKLMLVPIPRRRRNELRVIRPPSTAGVPPTTSSGTGPGSGSASLQLSASGGAAKRDPLIADAVLDENVVHAMQRSSVVDAPELVCLSADVRVGPLAPHACASVELRFLALREGVVGLEAVRVVDLGTQEHVDVRDLPLVVVKGGSTAASASASASAAEGS